MTTAKKIGASLIVLTAFTALALFSYQLRTSATEEPTQPTPTSVPAKPTTVEPEGEARFVLRKDDGNAPKVSMSIERQGHDVKSITVYDTDGKPAIRVLPDGNVEIYDGRKPDEAARIFWKVVASYLNDCSKPKA